MKLLKHIISASELARIINKFFRFIAQKDINTKLAPIYIKAQSNKNRFRNN